MFIFEFPVSLDVLHRSLAIRKLIEFGDPNFISEGKRRFEQYAAGTLEIVADLRIAVYKAMLHGGGKNAVDQLLKVFIIQTIINVAHNYLLLFD